MRTITISRWMLVGVGLLATVSVTACSTYRPNNLAAPPSSSTATSLAATATASPATAAPQPSPTTPGTSSCAQFAAHTFLHLVSATNEPDGSLTLTANPATVVCGGLDDLHYDIAADQVTAQLIPNASVTIFSLSSMQPLAIAPSQLVTYLPADRGTRIFLVSGPLSAITSLQEQYHP